MTTVTVKKFLKQSNYHTSIHTPRSATMWYDNFLFKETNFLQSSSSSLVDKLKNPLRENSSYFMATVIMF
ncbi:hypothetical protein DERP_009567 [Dermatophagoides pteronyssinus]|uniref:Uncharacterized protein n=1 Tax=Dermatophagoides pteronyssinus TaxID=6956 RepID=A0ABQ8JA94_DERPT|nr:hypothetical protein DERP_009567 [Dermatophagoides pteronyssinus]